MAKKTTSIYIKPSRKKCSVSDYKCFEIYNQDFERIDTKDIDVIDIFIDNNKYGCISMEIVNGMTHIWSYNELEIDILINTCVIRIKG
jgi:hypothetical protein